jgi:large subunit ribosomal protein L9
MKVIMLKDVRGVGQRGTVQVVSDGYALNMLIPQGAAQQATPQNLAKLEAHQADDAVAQAQREKEWAAALKKLDGANVVVAARANEHGHLYRQLTNELVVQGIKEEYGVDVPPNALGLEHPIKTTGDFTLAVTLGSGTTNIRLSVISADK